MNEADVDDPDWQTSFHKCYEGQLIVKRRYYPTGVSTLTAVGSEHCAKDA